MYYGARYYDPKVGRFMGVDPILKEMIDSFSQIKNSEDIKNSKQKLKKFISNPQNLNSYSYVTNNPLKYKDPTGKLKVHTEGATEEQIEKFDKGLKKAFDQAMKNLDLQKYFQLFDVDIINVLGNENLGPDVYLGGNYSEMLGRYSRVSNEVFILNPSFTDHEIFTIEQTLIHELAHWANDTAKPFGNLNPDITDFKKARESLAFMMEKDTKIFKDVIYDGVYGYLAFTMWK